MEYDIHCLNDETLPPQNKYRSSSWKQLTSDIEILMWELDFTFDGEGSTPFNLVWLPDNRVIVMMLRQHKMPEIDAVELIFRDPKNPCVEYICRVDWIWLYSDDNTIVWQEPVRTTLNAPDKTQLCCQPDRFTSKDPSLNFLEEVRATEDTVMWTIDVTRLLDAFQRSELWTTRVDLDVFKFYPHNHKNTLPVSWHYI
jgi:hypothetical protein